MLVPSSQAATLIEIKHADVVRNDRMLAAAAAKMTADLSRRLLVSRMLTAFAITACLMVLYVVQHQDKTIAAQQQLIREIHQENQFLLQYRLQHPPAGQGKQPQEEQQPAAQQPSDDENAPAAVPNRGTAVERADGCRVGVCA